MTWFVPVSPELTTTEETVRVSGRSRLATGMDWFFLLPIAAVVLVFDGYRKGAGSIVRQHDNLDFFQAVFQQVTLADLFSMPGSTIPYLLGGLDRGFLGSEFHFGHLSTVLLPVIWAMLLNELATRLLAFFGMRQLLKVSGIGDRRWIVFAVSSLFSILPFYQPAFGGVAAFPFLLAAFISVVQKRRVGRAEYAVFVLFPFYAAAFITIPMVLFFALGSIVAVLIYGRVLITPLFRALLVFGSVIVAVDWRLFLVSLTGPVSHRSEMIRSGPFSSDIWERAVPSLLDEYPHATAGKSTLLVLVILVGLAIGLSRSDMANKTARLASAASVVSLLGVAMFAQLWPWFEANVVADLMDGWGRFQMGRLRWVEPTLFTLLFALGLASFRPATDRVWVRGLSSILVLAVLAAQFQHVLNLRPQVVWPTSLTVEEYYAASTMAEIEGAISADGGDLAVSIGLHPAVAIFNVIESADGYWTSYPLDYKNQFRELISPALAASDPDRGYYDNWGSRVYVFQPDVDRPHCCFAPHHDEFNAVLNPEAFAGLRITHVISAAPIGNATEVLLELVLVADHESELGPTYLYRIVD